MRIKKNFDLTNYNSYRINARCRKAVFAENETDLINTVSSKNDFKDVIILGNGNNTILSKTNYDEEFLILNNCFNRVTIDGLEMSAEAGATLLELSEMALKNSLSGLEMFYDIPSSVGGAVVMNAGSSGEEIKDIITKVRYLDLKDLKIKELNVEELEFSYRNSFFQRNTNTVILKAWFRLLPGKPEDILKKMKEIKTKRWSKQPREYPNCGSVFKRPPGRFVGPMLDELGLKGYQIGGAQVSTKHSGFIVNTGNATGQDILDLIHHIKHKVKEKFQVELEVEQRII